MVVICIAKAFVCYFASNQQTDEDEMSATAWFFVLLSAISIFWQLFIIYNGADCESAKDSESEADEDKTNDAAL